MDYDATEIAERYHEARRLPGSIHDRWLQEIARSAPTSADGLVVDIGCGTGRFLRGLSEALHSYTIGVDRSRKMLFEVSRQSLGPQLCVARAESLPFRPHSLRLAFTSNVIHHVRGIGFVTRELHSLLAPGGVAIVRNDVREDLSALSYLRFFPEALAWSRGCLPTGSEIERAFVDAKFVVVKKLLIEQPVAASRDEYLLKIEQACVLRSRRHLGRGFCCGSLSNARGGGGGGRETLAGGADQAPEFPAHLRTRQD